MFSWADQLKLKCVKIGMMSSLKQDFLLRFEVAI
jgi:hypothetical protein